MSSPTENPFADVEAWDVTGGGGNYLPNGNHIVTIRIADDATARTSGNPQIYVEIEDDRGREKKHWVNYHANFLSQVVAVFDAAGIDRPQDGEFDPENNFRLTEGCRKRLIGKKVGVVMRDGDPSQKDGKIYPEVKGFTTVERLKEMGEQDMASSYDPAANDVPIDTAGLPNATPPPADDSEIPF